jgi:hypothetical protein
MKIIFPVIFRVYFALEMEQEPSSSQFKFPAFRTTEWLNSLIDSLYVFPSVLANIDLTPEYMANNPTANLYRAKAAAAREQIRRALFRHALFKIQNIEVTFENCREDRQLLSVQQVSHQSFLRNGWDKIMNPESQQLVSEELWTIDRCEKKRVYLVRYFKEGDDGFSTRVVPRNIIDAIGMFRYYFTS